MVSKVHEHCGKHGVIAIGYLAQHDLGFLVASPCLVEMLLCLKRSAHVAKHCAQMEALRMFHFAQEVPCLFVALKSGSKLVAL